jgi:transposase-like protein
MKIKPELNTKDGSFQQWLTGYFSELLTMFESMFELQRELPKRHQEVVEFLKQQPNRFQLVGYSSSDKLVEFNIINNPNIHHTAVIGAKLSVSEADRRTRVRFIFQEEDGDEILGTILLRRAESFEQGFLKDWPWIESRIENMFVGDRD